LGTSFGREKRDRVAAIPFVVFGCDEDGTTTLQRRLNVDSPDI